MSPLFRRRLRLVHRWIGLLVAIQLFCWVSGGVVMSIFPIDDVRGRDRVADQQASWLASAENYLPPQQLLQRFPSESVQSMRLAFWQGQAVYKIKTGSKTHLVDAVNGQALSPLSELQAEQVARADYAGPGSLIKMLWITEEALEYRGLPLPLWRADFDDARNTSLYISPDEGRVMARRNDIWRLFDFFWMLHIMDYSERDDFNHPLLIGFALTTLAFVFSGLLMLWAQFRPRT